MKNKTIIKKLLCILIVFSMTVGCIQMPVNAQNADSGVINPKGKISVKYCLSPDTRGTEITAYKRSDPLPERTKCAEKIREALRNRASSVTVIIPTWAFEDNASIDEMLFMAYDHTGVGTEGDYLRWHMKEWVCNGTIRTTYTTLTYKFEYIDGECDQEKMDAEIQEIEENLALEEIDDDYEKVRRVYDWMSSNITYAKTDTPFVHSAYATAVNHEAVCQGYASLMYRLLLDVGVDCRIIASDVHSWNLVKIGDKYYELDATWESTNHEQGQPYLYFLKSHIPGYDHTWLKDVIDESVYSLPLATSDYEYTYSEFKLISDCTLSVTGQYYTTQKGKGIPPICTGYVRPGEIPEVTLTSSDGTILVNSTDYCVTAKPEGTSTIKFRAAGIGNYYESITFMADVKLPTTSSLTVKKKSSGNTLTWKKVDYAQSYRVYRKTATGSYIKIATTTKLTYTDTKAKKNTQYTYAIRACSTVDGVTYLSTRKTKTIK